ncbi:unnamed protein product, partial [Polarella glacialis]
ARLRGSRAVVRIERQLGLPNSELRAGHAVPGRPGRSRGRALFRGGRGSGPPGVPEQPGEAAHATRALRGGRGPVARTGGRRGPSRRPVQPGPLPPAGRRGSGPGPGRGPQVPELGRG